MPESAPKRRVVRLLLAVALLAAAARGALWIEARRLPQFSVPVLDSRFYVTTGRALAAGESLPPTPFFMSPGYTGFAALCALLSGEERARSGPARPAPVPGTPGLVVAAQIAADVATCVLVAWLAARRLGMLAGAVAGLLLALHGPQILFTTRVLDATLGSFLVACLALACDRLERDRRPRSFAALGLLLGLLSTLRSTALLFVPVALALKTWRARRDGLRRNVLRAGALLLGVAVPIVPITIRNATAGGEAVLLTSSGGVNFLIGNARGTDGRFTTLNALPLAPGRFADDPTDGHFERSARRFAEERSGRPLSAGETSRFYARLAWREIAADPGAFALRLLRKLWLFLNAFEVPQVDNLYFLARYVAWLSPLSESSRVLWPLALFGLLFGARAARPPLLRALFWTHAAAIALFFVTDRYRLWMTPIAAFFAAAAVAKLAQVLRCGSLRARALHVGVLAGLGLACNVNPASFEPPDVAHPPGREAGGLFDRPADYLDFRAQHNNMAARCLEAGDAAAALAECERGLALSPGDPTLTLNLRRSLEALAPELYRLGEHERALPLLERWTRVSPGDPEAWNTLGATLLKLERAEEGIAALRRAMVLSAARQPAEMRYRYNLGLALHRLGRSAEAAPLLDAVLAAEPGNPGALLVRAEIHLAAGERDAARRLLVSLLARQPDHRRARELLDRCGE